MSQKSRAARRLSRVHTLPEGNLPATQGEDSEVLCSKGCPLGHGICAPPIIETPLPETTGGFGDDGFEAEIDAVEASMEADNCPRFGGFDPDLQAVVCCPVDGVTS